MASRIASLARHGEARWEGLVDHLYHTFPNPDNRDMGRQTGKDYARVLGLLAEPTEDEVKRAFRRLALKYHPDKVLLGQFNLNFK